MSDTPSLTASPVDALHAPGLHLGLHLLQSNQPLWRKVSGGMINSLTLTDRPEIRDRWERELRRTARHRHLSDIVELNVRPVLMEDARFIRNYMSIGDKWFLNGTAGGRLMKRYSRGYTTEHPEEDFTALLATHYDTARQKAGPIPEYTGAVSGIGFAIDARNLHNYYHFMKESFCNLCLVDDIEGFDGQVHIHAPARDPSGFIPAFLNAVFPDLASRTQITPSPQHYDRVFTAFSPEFYLWQAPQDLLDPLDPLIGHRVSWDHTLPHPDTMKTLALNSYSRSLRLLRERAYRAIEGQSFDHLPRRFWVGRAVEGKRDRTIVNEPKIIEALQARGFEVVYFEKLTPLEQIALMSRAEVMVSYHGAGFTNMLYANKDAHVIELGTLQSGILRWGDFIPFAHVAGCTYTLAVADYESDDPDFIPPIRGGKLHAVAISEPGIAALMAHIDGL